MTPLDAASVDRAIDAMVAAGRETLAVSLLHAYARPDHERRIGARIAERAPRSPCHSPRMSRPSSASTSAPARRSPTPTSSRSSTATSSGLEKALPQRGYHRDLFIMHSSGGLMSPELAREYPVRIIESGPAAGVLMCASVGQGGRLDQVVTFDMGGTTAKLGAVDGGAPAIMPTFEVDLVRYKKGSGLPISVPALEMIEIGAGGGSIARTDSGMITVGPDSAGSEPGPTCYGRGGTEPTITDANVVLGYIDPD